MQFLKNLIIGLLVIICVCALILPENAEKARIIDGLFKGVFAVFGLIILAYLVRLVRPAEKKKTREVTKTSDDAKPGRPVVVDGSNVMHWSGEPSFKVLSRVLKELQHRGLQPLVYFDANVGYKLFDRHVKPNDMAARLNLAPTQVTYASSRTPADEVLLEKAVADGLPVVTNDRFLDWKQRFPKIGEKGFLIKGMWKEGTVILLGLGRA